MKHFYALALGCIVAFSVACGEDTKPEPTPTPVVDAGTDSGTIDAGIDSGTIDAGLDAGKTDSGTTDAGTDAGLDAGKTDSGTTDAGTDAGLDAGTTVSNDTCDTITDITGQASVSGDTSSAKNTFGYLTTSTACEDDTADGLLGNDLVYSVKIAAGKSFQFTVTPATSAASFDAAIAVSTACATAATTCLAATDSAGPGKAESVTIKNSGTTEKTYILQVDGYDATDKGAFTLTTKEVLPPSNDTCSTAKTITLSKTAVVTENGSTTGSASDLTIDPTTLAETCKLGAGTSPWSVGEVMYSLSLPANSFVTIVGKPATGSSYQPALMLSSACATAAATCIAADYAFSSSDVTYFNRTASAMPLSLIVASRANTTAGAFTLELTTKDIPAAPANDVCSGAIDATPTGTTPKILDGTTFEATNDFSFSTTTSSAACQSGVGTEWKGRDVTYSVTIPANYILTAKVDPGTGLDKLENPSLAIVETCASALSTCLKSGNSFGSDTLTYKNATTANKTVSIIVDSVNPDFAGTFKLTTSLAVAPTAPANDLCAGAIDVTPTGTTPRITKGTTLAADDTVTFAQAGSSTACASAWTSSSANWDGFDVFYTVTVPAGKRLTAVVGKDTAVTTGQLTDPAIALVETCGSAASTCLVARDSGLEDTLVWNNTTGASKTLTLVIDSYSATTFGAFELSTTISDPPVAPANDMCPGRAILPTESLISGTTVGAENNYPFDDDLQQCTSYGNVCYYDEIDDATYCDYLKGSDVVYSISVPAGKKLTATATATGAVAAQVNFAVLISTSCGTTAEIQTQCKTVADEKLASSPEVATYTNTGATATTVYLFITSNSTTKQGTFDLGIQIQ